ncbi:hypothetical protein NBO_11g0044 [Nosema bombycis CQ1]|uniref:Uncharacterized protein n=1 Tax=Nosema bombycis (strain CQ1 / CVCC 102059) TaxID=578461 RepID=R0MQ34_NOSB1|nr:hypothetical protein NBO_11g0044 [Nosema bombycis CQ1]|eukprot:EOB14973.1 hypothetical protein NBO_11g0044 [Nosema bombycis CQ1]
MITLNTGDTFELLESIDKQSINSNKLTEFVDREDLKLYKYIYKHRLYFKKKIFYYLGLTLTQIIGEEKRRLSKIDNSCNQIEFMQENVHKVNFQIEKLRNRLYASKKESSTIINPEEAFITTETKILTIFLGKEVYFDDFYEKMFFMRHFKRHKNLFKSGEDKEFIIQDLFDKLKKKIDTKEDRDKLNKTLIDLGDKILLYFYFLSPFLTEATKIFVFEKVPIDQKNIVLDSLPREEAALRTAEVLLRETPKNKILFLNSVIIKDKLSVYYHLSQISMGDPLKLRKNFLETLDILKILPIDKNLSLLILIGWTKAFIYHKDLEEGIKLYKNLIKIVGKREEKESNWIVSVWDYKKGKKEKHDVIEDMTILSEFYNSVIEYKKSGHLNFENFEKLAEICEDKNPFCFYKWKRILPLYKRN